jgi:hypothetical protein
MYSTNILIGVSTGFGRQKFRADTGRSYSLSIVELDSLIMYYVPICFIPNIVSSTGDGRGHTVA